MEQQKISKYAAIDAVKTINDAVRNNGHAVWCLAGGTSPNEAYEIINSKYFNDINWSKVTLIIGDERHVKPTDNLHNWSNIQRVLFHSKTQDVKTILPDTTLSLGECVNKYSSDLAKISQIDLLWLGIGEDGHTLSLFPENTHHLEKSPNKNKLAIKITNSPKTPKERISISLNMVAKTKKAVIFATGKSKHDAILRARVEQDLPINFVAKTVEEAGGEVEWLTES